MSNTIKGGSLVKYGIEYGIVETVDENVHNKTTFATVKLEFNGIKQLPIENLQLLSTDTEENKKIWTRIITKN
ncbi:MAG: hypothetical protein JWO58_1617 [Chitinophagaceae bacterium]|nr:hypothetical protein [Chitinophagaceae bacterium]